MTESGVSCDECGRSINPKIETVYQAQRGWAKLRDQGGTNALVHRQAEPRFRCRGCIDVNIDGSKQEQLF